jgi:hypothetical protein
MITIKRDAFDLLEHLCEIYWRATNFGRNLRQSPTSGKIAGQQYLSPIGQPAASVSRTTLV